MAQMKPGFITGANAKLKMFNKTMAYCADVSYNISVQTIPIESIGKYEVHANEPVSYSVDGSFSVIRYTKVAKDVGKVANAAADGNAPIKVADGSVNMGQHVDPKQLLDSETFDLEIIEKRAGGLDQAIFTVKDCRLTRRGMTLNKRGVMVDAYSYVGILATDADIGAANAVGNSGTNDLS